MLQKTHAYLSKTAQSPQVVGAAGKTAFFFGTFFWASKRKYRCRAKVISPGRREQICDWFLRQLLFYLSAYRTEMILLKSKSVL
jgi:hypothetical protein